MALHIKFLKTFQNKWVQPPLCDDKMPQSQNQYSKVRWILTLIGFVLYLGDICTDIMLAVKYFKQTQYLWSGLTLTFVMTGMLVTQIFSCTWFWDDINSEGEQGKDSSKTRYAVMHVFGMGIFIRYCLLLKQSFKGVWTTTNADIDSHKLFCMAADLSMLKMFETFLESVPQLLLQLYILQTHHEMSVHTVYLQYIEYLSMAFSFFNAAWAVVDYRRCLRRSLPQSNKMPSGLPTVIYLLYKLCTITSLIFSYSLLLTLSIYSTVGFTVLWLLATTYVHLCKTNFCSSGVLELLYRAVIGVILIFTFFNVKGQDTKVPMTLYYILHMVINVTTPVLLLSFKSELITTMFFRTASVLISVGLAVGLLCLMWYYVRYHPSGTTSSTGAMSSGPSTTSVSDVVDGLEKGVEYRCQDVLQQNKTEKTSRINNFLQM